MLRMDFLLNPGSPPSSPVRTEREDNQVELTTTTNTKTNNNNGGDADDSPVELAGLRAYQPTPASPSSVPAVKRLKRDLPALRLVLDNAIDNQRDDAPHEIFSGHAFWGQVPSLNPSPSDIAQLEPSRVFPGKPFGRETPTATPLLPSLLHVVESTAKVGVATASEGEPSSPSETGDPLPVESTTPTPTTSSKGGKKKKITICKEDGCSSQALSKQLCMKHGGGPRCSVPDCNNGAKLRNLCFQHGGSTICLADGCSSKAKRFGYCWSHGGGRICGDPDCDKVAAQGGMCWAHGGGNRCKLEGCTKRSYKQHGYYCKRHAEVSADY